MPPVAKKPERKKPGPRPGYLVQRECDNPDIRPYVDEPDYVAHTAPTGRKLKNAIRAAKARDAEKDKAGLDGRSHAVVKRKDGKEDLRYVPCIPHWWVKGQSGNPGGVNGQEKKMAIKSVLNRIGGEYIGIKDENGKKECITRFELLARQAYRQACEGDDKAREFILDRTEGKLTATVRNILEDATIDVDIEIIPEDDFKKLQKQDSENETE